MQETVFMSSFVFAFQSQCCSRAQWERPGGGEARGGAERGIDMYRTLWWWWAVLFSLHVGGAQPSAMRLRHGPKSSADGRVHARCTTSADYHGCQHHSRTRTRSLFLHLVDEEPWTRPLTSRMPPRRWTWPTSASSSCALSPPCARLSQTDSQQQSSRGHNHLPPD